MSHTQDVVVGKRNIIFTSQDSCGETVDKKKGNHLLRSDRLFELLPELE
jgi:hypothetical protein